GGAQGTDDGPDDPGPDAPSRGLHADGSLHGLDGTDGGGLHGSLSGWGRRLRLFVTPCPGDSTHRRRCPHENSSFSCSSKSSSCSQTLRIRRNLRSMVAREQRSFSAASSLVWPSIFHSASERNVSSSSALSSKRHCSATWAAN